MKISKHFTIQEACRSMTADRCGIDNTAPPNVAKNLVLVAENILEPIREHYKIPFTPNVTAIFPISGINSLSPPA